jgi:CspA family cold shock protein
MSYDDKRRGGRGRGDDKRSRGFEEGGFEFDSGFGGGRGGGGGGAGGYGRGGFGGGQGGFGGGGFGGGGGGGFGGPRGGGFGGGGGGGFGGGGGGGFGDRPPRRDFARDEGGPTYAISGTVKWFDQVRGFGFVTPDDGGQDVFLHSSVLQRAGKQDVQQGEKVALDVRDGQRGRQAVNIK